MSCPTLAIVNSQRAFNFQHRHHSVIVFFILAKTVVVAYKMLIEPFARFLAASAYTALPLHIGPAHIPTGLMTHDSRRMTAKKND